MIRCSITSLSYAVFDALHTFQSHFHSELCGHFGWLSKELFVSLEVTISYVSCLLQSKSKNKTSNPFWAETFTFDVPSTIKSFSVMVWDLNRIIKCKFLGKSLWKHSNESNSTTLKESHALLFMHHRRKNQTRTSSSSAQTRAHQTSALF